MMRDMMRGLSCVAAVSLAFYYTSITTAFRLGEVKYYKPEPWRVRFAR